ncbi:hypothetical protein GWI33_012416 [Rhynchophorus ferrugineus]|uniref:Uncharacterized protein n=1 Tax=Rhynchophorus ferrugineus TaxID=354439 RepID=A0A834I5G7_RHYFE|nr:hypothetical protein GWI33_012416 [Rhynchophorus ferrugineus]
MEKTITRRQTNLIPGRNFINPAPGPFPSLSRTPNIIADPIKCITDSKVLFDKYQKVVSSRIDPFASEIGVPLAPSTIYEDLNKNPSGLMP